MKIRTARPATAGTIGQAAGRWRRRKRRRRAGVSSLPTIPDLIDKPQAQQSERAAGGVNENIGDQRRAIGDEALMKFVGGGVEKNHQHRAADFRPRPVRQLIFLPMQRPPDQQREHGIFGEVAAFAENMMQLGDVGRRHLGKQPPQQRFKKTRRMIVGLRVAGRRENEPHPQQRRQPEFQK